MKYRPQKFLNILRKIFSLLQVYYKNFFKSNKQNNVQIVLAEESLIILLFFIFPITSIT